MDFILKSAVLALIVAGPVSFAADKPVVKKKQPEFVKIDEEEAPKKSPKFIKIDENEDEELLKEARESITSSLKTVSDEPKEPAWNDLGGQSFTGVPRLIRQDPMTEVFFRDLKESYVIHTDSKHNANFKVFDEASRANRPVTFRADPVSRRILVVDGVAGARAPTTATGAGAAPASTGGVKAGSK